MIGSSIVQRACASGQRVRRRQPEGGAIGEAGSPAGTSGERVAYAIT